MTQEELNRIIDSDSYFAARKDPSEAEIRLFLREVDFHCPLCGVELQSRQQKKPRHKRFEIAHIYPNRPTIEQYLALDGVERLGNNSESFENKIALCMTCHSTQDFHTTAEDYNRLLNIKKQCLLSSAMNDLSKSLDLEEKISDILLKLTSLSENDIAALNYTPVPVANKFSNSEFLLISDDAIENILAQYSTCGKQIIIALDKQDSYSAKTASELEEHTVLRLAPGGDELFGRSWSNQTSKG